MNPILYDLSLDATASGAQASIHVKQNDQRTRRLVVRLMDGGGTVFALNDTMTATLRALKPDETILYDDCEVVGNTLRYTLSGQLLAVAGTVECQLTLYDEDLSVLSTPEFSVYVESPLFEDTLIESANDFTALQTAMAGFLSLTSATETAEATRQALYTLVQQKLADGDFTGPTGPIGPQGPRGLSGDGTGDMLRSDYDVDENGVVDDSELLGGQPPAYYATAAHNHDATYAALSHTHTAAQAGLSSVTLTLAAADWTAAEGGGATQTETVTGLLATDTLLVSPAPASFTAYGDAGLYASAQAAGALSFSCARTPTVAVEIQLLILR